MCVCMRTPAATAGRELFIVYNKGSRDRERWVKYGHQIRPGPLSVHSSHSSRRGGLADSSMFLCSSRPPSRLAWRPFPLFIFSVFFMSFYYHVFSMGPYLFPLVANVDGQRAVVTRPRLFFLWFITVVVVVVIVLVVVVVVAHDSRL